MTTSCAPDLRHAPAVQQPIIIVQQRAGPSSADRTPALSYLQAYSWRWALARNSTTAISRRPLTRENFNPPAPLLSALRGPQQTGAHQAWRRSSAKQKSQESPRLARSIALLPAFVYLLPNTPCLASLPTHDLFHFHLHSFLIICCRARDPSIRPQSHTPCTVTKKPHRTRGPTASNSESLVTRHSPSPADVDSPPQIQSAVPARVSARTRR